MKTELFNWSGKLKKGRKNEKSGGQRYDIFLFKAGVIVLVLMIAAQVTVASPIIRSHNFYENYEGEPLGKEAYLFSPCKMELKLINLEKCPELKVLVNGVERCSFEKREIRLNLKDGDVIELDAGKVIVLAKVRINAVSLNIESLLGKTVTASHGILPVAVVNCHNTGKGTINPQ
jgi:hypothetical protein